jgi:hypothetical protein
MDFDEAYDINLIQLEPRLQEYLRRKRFNEENDIEPPITEEQEFCISSHDLKIIKKHSQGKQGIHSNKYLAKDADSHFVVAEGGDFEIETDFKKDPRYQRLQRKMQSHKDAQSKIRDMSGIDRDYEIFHRMADRKTSNTNGRIPINVNDEPQCQANPYDLSNSHGQKNPFDRPDQRPMRMTKPYDEPNQPDDRMDLMDNGDVSFMMDSRDFVLDSGRQTRKNNVKERERSCYNPNRKSGNENTYNHPPKISYHQYIMPQRVSGGLEHSRNVNEVIGDLDQYNKHLNNTYEYIQSDADLDTKTFTSGQRTGTQREMHNSYQSVPFMYGNGLPDITVEESLKGGIRDSSKKSIGFRNPFENQFAYISKDISDANHTVQMWPQTTRGRSSQIARPNSSAVLSERRIRKGSAHSKH